MLGRFAFLGFGRHVTARALGIAVLAGLPLSLAIFALADGTAALVLFALLLGLALLGLAAAIAFALARPPR